VEDYDRPFVDVEAIDRPQQRVTRKDLLERVPIRRLRSAVDSNETIPGSPSDAVPAGVHEDPVEPGREGFGLTKGPR
jgi:hypothetical protein